MFVSSQLQRQLADNEKMRGMLCYTVPHSYFLLSYIVSRKHPIYDCEIEVQFGVQQCGQTNTPHGFKKNY
jgi:hypothetical protein